MNPLLLSLVGGILIGLSAALYLVTIGRVAGISGIVARLIDPTSSASDRFARLAFVGGLLAAGVGAKLLYPDAFGQPTHNVIALVGSGLLVGFGTRLGGGCTSGHGVCGIGRLSIRSVVATCIFMFVGMLAVFVVRRFVGGAS